MNDKMLDIIGLADEEYLRETEMKNTKTIKHRRRRFSAGMVAAAVIGLSTVTASAAVIVTKLAHKESVDHYYNKEMASQIEEYGLVSGQITQNEHIRMTLENLMVDENYAYGVVTVECLDDEGKNALNKMPFSFMHDSDGNLIFPKGDDFTTTNFGLISNGMLNTDISKRAYLLQVYLHGPFSETKTELPDTVKVSFSESFPNRAENISELEKDTLSGLCFDISTKANVNYVKLESEEGRKGVVSQYRFDFISAEWGEQSNTPNTVTLFYKDGTELTFTNGVKGKGGFMLESVSHFMDGRNETRAFFEQIVTLDGLESVEFAGETYKVLS